MFQTENQGSPNLELPSQDLISVSLDEQVSKIELQQVIDLLPPLLKKCLMPMKNDFDKSIGLFTLLVMFGTLLPKVKFKYNSLVSYCNLFLLILFPPASGKGKQIVYRTLFDLIIQEQIEQNATSMKDYRKALAIYKTKIERGEDVNEPDKPKTPLLLVPGNITSSKFIDVLNENEPDCMTLIFEPEADVLSDSMHSTYGSGFSAVLRAGFQNEPISLMRKTNSEHLLIQQPKVSVILAGTNSQTAKFFKSTSDGLLTRFLNKNGEAPLLWNDVTTCDTCESLNEQIAKYQADCYKMYKKYQSLNVEIRFSHQQYMQMNEFGESRLFDIVKDFGGDAAGIAKRHGLMLAKIASILTMLRHYESDLNLSLVNCIDDDILIAKWMVEDSFECSRDLFEELTSKQVIAKSKEEIFFEKLPVKFKRGELAPIEKMLSIDSRTIDRRLEQLLLNGKIISPKKGYYEKVVVSDLSDGGLEQ